VEELGFNTPDYAPASSDVIARYERTLNGIALRNSEGTPPKEEMRLEIRDDGTIRYYLAGVAVRSPEGEFVIMEGVAARLIAYVVRFAGDFLAAARYHGYVHAMVALLGAANARSAEIRRGLSRRTASGFPEPDYRGHAHVPAELLVDDPIGITRRLFQPVLRLVSPGGDPLKTIG
jgi:hypothetical protein